MLLLNIWNAFCMALGLFVVLGLALGRWFGVDLLVFTGVLFAALMLSDLGEALLVRWFNREPEPTLTREGYREGY